MNPGSASDRLRCGKRPADEWPGDPPLHGAVAPLRPGAAAVRHACRKSRQRASESVDTAPNAKNAVAYRKRCACSRPVRDRARRRCLDCHHDAPTHVDAPRALPKPYGRRRHDHALQASAGTGPTSHAFSGTPATMSRPSSAKYRNEHHPPVAATKDQPRRRPRSGDHDARGNHDDLRGERAWIAPMRLDADANAYAPGFITRHHALREAAAQQLQCTPAATR